MQRGIGDSMNTITNLIADFVVDVCANKHNETGSAYASKLKHLVMFFGDIDPAGLSRSDLERFKKYLQERNTKRNGSQIIQGALSPFTIFTVLRTTTQFLRWLYRSGYIPIDIVQGFVLPTPPKPEPKAIATVTVDRMIATTDEVGEDWEQARNLAIIYMLRDTNARIGGLVNAELGDLFLQSGFLVTKEKGDTRTLFMSPQTVEVLRVWLDYRTELKPKDNKLFISARGTGLTRGGMYSAVRRVAKAAKITDRHNPHSFRHAWARDAILINHADLSYVSQLMGHSDTRVTTEYYARYNIHELQRLHRLVTPGNTLPRLLKKRGKS